MHRMAHTPTPYVTDPNTCVSVLLGPCQPHAWTFAHVCCACSFMQVARKSIAFADHQNYFDCCTVLTSMGGTKAIFLNTLLYVVELLGWLGFRPFDALYTQRIRIGWGQMMVLFIWPQSHLDGTLNTKVRSLLCCPWWGQHLGHDSGPICSVSRTLANGACKFG
jgi:hypothetical protein